jgi:hypothetical protein
VEIFNDWPSTRSPAVFPILSVGIRKPLTRRHTLSPLLCIEPASEFRVGAKRQWVVYSNFRYNKDTRYLENLFVSAAQAWGNDAQTCGCSVSSQPRIDLGLLKSS